MKYSCIKKEVEKAVAQANFCLRPDVKKALKKAYASEKVLKAKTALGWILDNAGIAEKESIALCQDTGLPVVFIEAGKKMRISGGLIAAVEKGIEAGYRKNSLRPSIVDPLDRCRPSYKGMAYHIDFFSAGRKLKITILPKGFGSENKSRLKMFNPTAEPEEIENFITEAVKEAGAQSCPPFVIGVGVGGTCDSALMEAKRALLIRIDKPNPDRKLDRMEKRIFKKVNSLGIGPMGLGGKCTALAVRIRKIPTHIAGLPVGVNISCHALRSSVVELE
ncbi:MAG: fumarate hydratase [Candidatus Omnitrophica bacterium]|nr:fumarate hydratase [Candidatus Omnitrophota bacterium]MDD5429951.1 fumarate hydratase [Candidatus Omnitrophota bacterium]